MALEGTHIRFALDVKNALGVKNIQKYISGTIYPDSRYVTKIDRNLTHKKEFRSNDFCVNDDFKKGWLAHLVCDKAQYYAMLELFDDLLSLTDPEIKHGNDNWVLRTAIKILQDIEDVKNFNISDYLKHLQYIENPNNENLEDLKRYNQIFISLYKQAPDITVDDLKEMWLIFGIDENLAGQVKEKAYQLQGLSDIIDRLNKMYHLTLKTYTKYII